MTLVSRKQMIEAELSAFAGEALEITVRGLHAFTVSGEGDIRATLEKVRARYFASVTDWRAEYDEEADYTCAYLTATEGGAL